MPGVHGRTCAYILGYFVKINLNYARKSDLMVRNFHAYYWHIVDYNSVADARLDGSEFSFKLLAYSSVANARH